MSDLGHDAGEELLGHLSMILDMVHHTPTPFSHHVCCVSVLFVCAVCVCVCVCVCVRTCVHR